MQNEDKSFKTKALIFGLIQIILTIVLDIFVAVIAAYYVKTGASEGHFLWIPTAVVIIALIVITSITQKMLKNVQVAGWLKKLANFQILGIFFVPIITGIYLIIKSRVSKETSQGLKDYEDIPSDIIDAITDKKSPWEKF
ncbi:hypothetical protein JN00_0039 [Metamycoplasma subdolum]|uniref:Uncharacterized protein n=1 Tax=Metamycoplasma subdolum TaxID=92407 RepID=A0A3M0A9A8_9BACT|nr:hypothetical protein [Metamycoplasma subdolum]RMA78995.1 hypothetical protein JN00_0039 [Metamycoplasma subdolum]WPB50518.1 hypothetical protein R9C05_02825 [Metamycoplasma subdolum]